MRKLIIGVILGALGFFAYDQYRDGAAQQQRAAAEDARAEQTEIAFREPQVEHSSPPEQRRCDGRVYCSQMASCEEATWFLQHCPGVMMDGEGDGVPCEKQWCGRR